MSSWLSYAEWYASRGLNERAEATRKGLNRLPDAAALHHAISSIFEAQGYREIALKALKKAVSLAPDRVDFGDELARLEFFQDLLNLHRPLGNTPGSGTKESGSHP